MTEKTRSLW